MKVAIIFIYFLLPLFCCSQKDTTKNKLLYSIEQKSYVSKSYYLYSGNEFNFSLLKAITKKNYIGLSFGWFFHTNNEKSRMKYNYFPIYLSFFHHFKKKNSLQFKIGSPILTYFDSDYILRKSELTAKSFWLNYNQVYETNTIPRNKFWLIIQPSYAFRIYKHVHVNTGLTFYVGKNYLFSFLNLGFSYHLKK